MTLEERVANLEKNLKPKKWLTLDADILTALNDGNISPLLGEKYEPWVIGVYYRIKAERLSKKPNSVK